MIQFENSDYIVIIEDGFIEAAIKMVKQWREIFKDGDIEDFIIREVVDQMEDGSKYINFYFEGDRNTARELGQCPNMLSLFIGKEKVTLRNKVKSVRIKKGSIYEGLNDDPGFIRALISAYNDGYNTFWYFLPVRYEKSLTNKEDEGVKNSLIIGVDIPFSDIEVY